MPCTVCTCIRVGLRRLMPDPDCRSPSHDYDELVEMDDD